MDSSDDLPLVALGRDGKVDHHDGVLLHNADQENDADDGNNAELRLKQKKREHGADTGGGQRRQDRDGMDIAFVQNAKHDVDGAQRGGDEERFASKRVLIGLRSSGKSSVDGGRQAGFQRCRVDHVHGVPQCDTGLQIKGNGVGRKQALMRNSNGGGLGLETKRWPSAEPAVRWESAHIPR